MEFLKSILSKESYDKVAEAMGADLFNQASEKVKDLTIDAGAEKLVPHEKFESERVKVKELTEQLAARDKQLKDLEPLAAGNAALQEQIKTLQAENEKTVNEFQTKLTAQAFDFALEDALKGAKARSTKAVRALLETDKLNLKEGKIEGLDEQLKAVKEANGFLFEDEAGNGTGAPNIGGNPEPQNAFDFKFTPII